MELFLNILLVLVYLSISGFLIYFIFFLKDLLKSIKNIDRNISESVNKLNQVLEKFQNTLEDLSTLSKNINSQINYLSSTLEPFKETARDYKRIKDKVVNTIEQPIDELQSNARALLKGIKVFFQTLFRRSG